MAGTLNSSRFRNALASSAGTRPRDVTGLALDSHGAEMVPVTSSATINGRPASDVLGAEVVGRRAKETLEGGAAVVAPRRTGSAFIARRTRWSRCSKGCAGDRRAAADVGHAARGVRHRRRSSACRPGSDGAASSRSSSSA